MNRHAEERNAFTLLEVILAISLTAVVLVLLMTALDLLLTRVESSRSRIETSQVARGVLNLISADLRATRYYTPSQDSGSSEDAAVSIDSTGESSSEKDSETQESETLVLGIFGNAKEIRIDRSSAWKWERVIREEDEAAEGASTDEMPQTIRYFLNEGDTTLVDTYAGEGIAEGESLLSYAGLSREQMSTSAWVSQFETDDSESSEANTDSAQLIAPEVLDIEFAYFDGEEMLEEWDSAEQGGLPEAVEVTLMLANEPKIDLSKSPPDDPEELLPQEDDTTEYRLFVRLPKIELQKQVSGPQGLESETEKD